MLNAAEPFVIPLIHFMPTTHFFIPTMTRQEDADAVMFELQDLPCIHVADVSIPQRTAWAEHTNFISPEEITNALAQAGYPATVQSD
jgi:hypothetical protein